MALLKLLSGWFFNSIAIMADAVNNLSDSASSIVTLVGFKLSSKPADAKHPYGHARIEYISGMIVSFIVVVLGVQLAQSSIDKILAPEESSFTWITIGVLVGVDSSEAVAGAVLPKDRENHLLPRPWRPLLRTASTM